MSNYQSLEKQTEACKFRLSYEFLLNDVPISFVPDRSLVVTAWSFVSSVSALQGCLLLARYKSHPMVMGWLLTWTPFKIDALGLISILGADEVDRSIGRLSRSCLTEYLPLISSFVIANDGIRSPIPGFVLYNISDGICATDLAGWFSRWLLSQDLTYNCTTLTINIRHPFRPPRDDPFLAAGIGMAICFVMTLLPALMGDW